MWGFMATVRVKLTKGAVLAAIARMGKGEMTYSDTQSKGLALRVRTSSAIWCLRARLGPKQSTWRIAEATGDWLEPNTAREAASEAWKLIKRGKDPKDRLREIEFGGPVERHFDGRDGWTFEHAREQYLAHVLRDKAPATHRDYRSNLNSPDLAPLKDLLVSQITPQHVMRIQDAIYDRGKLTQARHVTQVLKPFLTWVAGKAGSGISESPIASVKPLAASRVPQEKGRLPTEAELGELPWKLEAAAISSQSRLAGLLIWLTAQRIETVITARKEHFEETGATTGIWTIPPASMKSKREHALPLPPATWDVVKQAMALNPDPAGWLFPQVRPRRKGGPADGHVSYHPVAEPMSPLDPHDMRRAFATHGQVRLGMKPSDTKAILDHAEGKSGDVTAERYALHDGRHFKWALMKAWEDYLLGLTTRHCTVAGARLRTLMLPGDLFPPVVASGSAVPLSGAAG